MAVRTDAGGGARGRGGEAPIEGVARSVGGELPAGQDSLPRTCLRHDRTAVRRQRPRGGGRSSRSRSGTERTCAVGCLSHTGRNSPLPTLSVVTIGSIKHFPHRRRWSGLRYNWCAEKLYSWINDLV